MASQNEIIFLGALFIGMVMWLLYKLEKRKREEHMLKMEDLAYANEWKKQEAIDDWNKQHRKEESYNHPHYPTEETRREVRKGFYNWVGIRKGKPYDTRISNRGAFKGFSRGNRKRGLF